MSVAIGWVDEPFFRFMEWIFGTTADRIGDLLAFPFFTLMTKLRLGRYTFEPTEKDTMRTKCFWDEATLRGIKMKEFHLGPVHDSFIAEYTKNGKYKKMVFDGLPRPNKGISPALLWMDNKGVMKKRFKEVGLPVAEGGVAFTKKRAIEIFHSLEKPIATVITKPNLGSRSRHTTIHVGNIPELIRGFKVAKKLSPLVIVEDELRGSLYRGTLIGKKLVAVVRRDPPQVTGDGIKNLGELVDESNRRLEEKVSKDETLKKIFHKITIDKDAERELERQKIKLSDVPEKGRVVSFSQKTSRGIGGTTTEVTPLVHPDNVEMLENVAKLLDDSLIGVDFIMEDITKSWKEEQHSGIIECNSLPFIDLHHYPLEGAPVNVAGALWDLVLPESKV